MGKPPVVTAPPEILENPPKVITPPDASVVERTAQGKPAVAEKEGVRYYQPDSTMYKMGFRTSTEYAKAQKLGVSYGASTGDLVPKDSVIVDYGGQKVRVSSADYKEGPEGGVVANVIARKVEKGKYKIPVIATSERGETTQLLLSPDKARTLSKLQGDDRLQQAIKFGLVPPDTKLIKGEWRYFKEKPKELTKKVKDTKPISSIKPPPGVTEKYAIPKGVPVKRDVLEYLKTLQNPPDISKSSYLQDTKEFYLGISKFFSETAKANIDPFKNIIKSDLPLSEKARQIGLHAADLLVPGVWARHWDDLSLKDKAINIGFDLIILIPVVNVASVGIRSTIASMFKSPVKKELKKTLVKLETGLEKGNVNFIKQSGQELKQIASQVDKNGGGRSLWQRGALLEMNAGEIADYARTGVGKQLSKNEIILLKSSIKDQKKVLKKITSETKVDPEYLKKTIVETSRYDPLSPPGRPPFRTPTTPTLKVTSGGARIGIPITAFNTMTSAQVAKAYGIGVGFLIKAIGTQLPEVAEQLDSKLITKPSDVPLVKPRIKPTETPKISPKPSKSPAPAQKPSVAPFTSPAPKSQVVPSLAAKGEPSRVLAPAPAPALKPMAKPAPKTAQKIPAKTTTKTTTKAPIKVAPPLPVRLGKGQSMKTKLAIIKSAPGAVAWRSGELDKDDIIHVIMHPWRGKGSHTTLKGKIPAGFKVVTGKGSAANTAVLLYGREPPKEVMVDMGIVDVHVNPGGKGVKVNFSADPKQITTGHISIGSKSPRISPKMPRLK